MSSLYLEISISRFLKSPEISDYTNYETITRIELSYHFLIEILRGAFLNCKIATSDLDPESSVFLSGPHTMVM